MADDTTGSSRRGRGHRTVVVAVAGWLGVVVVVSALAWFAIGSAGSEVLEPTAQGVPSSGLPSGTDPSGYPVPTPTGTPTGSGSASPSTGSSSGPVGPSSVVPSPVDTVYSVTGGQVGCRCTGDQVSLNGAWPDEGWAAKSSTSDGGSRLRVEFEADDRRTRVEATCVSGAPSVSVEDGSGGGSDDGGGDDGSGSGSGSGGGSGSGSGGGGGGSGSGGSGSGGSGSGGSGGGGDDD